MDLVSQIGAALDEGGYDADDLTRWYWQLEGAITEDWRITQAEPLYNLRHEVMEAMIKHILEHSVKVGPLVPTKQRLEWDRLIRARVDDPDPILVIGSNRRMGARTCWTATTGWRRPRSPGARRYQPCGSRPDRSPAARDRLLMAGYSEARHLEVDHIIFRAKGGTDHIENLQLLCGSCNRIKGVLDGVLPAEGSRVSVR